jgi:hypothetical protein
LYSYIVWLNFLQITLAVLDANEKMSHFKKYWDEDLQKRVLEDAERIVSLIYKKKRLLNTLQN